MRTTTTTERQRSACSVRTIRDGHGISGRPKRQRLWGPRRRHYHATRGRRKRHQSRAQINAMEFVLSPNIRATTSAREALENASVIVHAIPLQSTESFLEEVIDYIPKDGEIVFISTSKGIETETLELPCHVLERVLYRQKKKSRRRKNVKLAYLSGPTFAKQLINETPSGAVMAARTMSLSKKACRYYASPSFRCYPS